MGEAREVLVHVHVTDRVGTLVLDSPANRNALSRRLVQQVHDGLTALEGDDDVRVVVLRATGGTFCSGADLAEAAEDGMEQTANALVALQRRLVSCDKPVLARVHGHVRAGGIGVVAACDVALSAEDASYAFTEVRLGLAPAAISLTVLPRLTDRAAALTFLTGEPFDGREAERIGLVTRAVPADRLDEEVARLSGSLAQGSPQGLRETKRLVARHVVERIDAHGDDLAALSARLFGSNEARAAMREFLARRR